MFRKIFNYLPLGFKFFLAFLLIIAGFLAGGYFFLGQLSSLLLGRYGIDFSAISVMQKDLLRFVLVVSGVILLILVLLYRNITRYLSSIDGSLAKAVQKRRLLPYFEAISTHDYFQSIPENANTLLGMFKNFDTMKSARISMEVNTVKLLLNRIRVGVLFINKDRIVTHVNHNAEEILGLKPGEVIGQALSRHISNETFLEGFEAVLARGERMTDAEMVIRDQAPLGVSILPVKNKYGELVRVVALLSPAEVVVPEESEEVGG